MSPSQSSFIVLQLTEEAWNNVKKSRALLDQIVIENKGLPFFRLLCTAFLIKVNVSFFKKICLLLKYEDF